MTFYELDPDIAKIAWNRNLFNFVSECAPEVPIVRGDARLTLADAPDGIYDFIFVDAFLGASIPVHLLTAEAMDLYFRKLKPNGVLGMHIANRNLELSTVVADVGKSKGLIVRIYDGGDVQEDASEIKWVPRVAAVARRDAGLGGLASSQYWPLRNGDSNRRVWTDDYSNIAGAMLAKLRE
ncbi:MAG: fused MFS/spermidine synthase [Hyphomicrobiaceae bacterium]